MNAELFEFERQLWARASDADFYAERLTDDAVLVFPAPVGAYCASAYVPGDRGWELALHQQTPLEDAS